MTKLALMIGFVVCVMEGHPWIAATAAVGLIAITLAESRHA